MKHPWAIPLIGSPEDVSSKSTSVDINLAMSGNQPLGLYTEAGTKISIRIASQFINSGLSIQIGEALDDLKNANTSTVGQWRRAPFLLRRFAVNSEETVVSNAYGGPMYLVVPAELSGSLSVTVANAHSMPIYTLNETTTAVLNTALDTTNSPVTILQSRANLRMAVSTQSARDK